MLLRSLIAADRRNHTCLRDAREHCRPLQAAGQNNNKKKLRVLKPHPKTVSDTAHRQA